MKTTLLFIAALLVTLAVAFLAATAERMFAGVKFLECEEEKGRKFYRFRIANALAGAGQEGWIKAIVLGLIAGVINFTAPQVGSMLWLAPIMLVVMMGLMLYLVFWWHKDGSTFWELLCFVLMEFLFYRVSLAVIAIMKNLVKDTFWMSLIAKLPLILLVFCIGFFIVDALLFYYRKTEDDGKATRAHVLAWVAMIVTLIIILSLLVFSVRWSAFKWPSSNTSTTTQTTTTTKNVSWYGFYNLNMLKDKDDANDFNFGPNPYEESKTAKDYDKEFRDRIKLDPALGSACMAWFDANMGTRFMGVFYDEVDQKWDAAINYAKERFMKDQVLYYKTLDAFFAFLDTANKVEITNAKGIDDQMYMNPYTVNGIPDVIVMETDDHTGHFLTYTFTIKDAIFEVSYRIECGFQPCDVADIMKITPQEKPKSNPTPTYTPSETEPKPKDPEPTNPPETDPKPTDPEPTDPKPKKDPTLGTPVGKNDDPGPGPNTNNGVGAQYSSEEKPTNSTYKSYDEYKETMKELEKVNETQKQGGDPNTPTVTPEPGTKVDSNADKGTGNGGIDETTPVQEPVHVVTPDGETEPLSSDPGTAWGGPVD